MFVEVEEFVLLVVVPGLLVDCGVEVVVPAFAALLAGALGDRVVLLQLAGDLRPVVQPELPHQLADRLVFLPTPSPTSQLHDCLFISNLYKIYIY